MLYSSCKFESLMPDQFLDFVLIATNDSNLDSKKKLYAMVNGILNFPG